jgi:hypothetical protein
MYQDSLFVTDSTTHCITKAILCPISNAVYHISEDLNNVEQIKPY